MTPTAAQLQAARDFQAPNPRAVIGGNEPPLDQLLAEETADLTARATALIESAGRAAVTDEETAGKAALLAGMIREHIKAIGEAREARKRPFLEAGRTVDAHFNAIAGTLATYTKVGTKEHLAGGPLHRVLGMVDTYRRGQEAKAEAERKRLEEEARKAREAAEAAQRAQQEAEERARREAEDAARRVREAEEAAQRAQDREAAAKAQAEAAEARRQQEAAEAAAREQRMAAEIEERQRREEAERLERQAAETRAGPIDTGLGIKASGRKVYTAEIVDLTAAIRHARKVDEAAVKAAVQTIYDRQVRAGVRELPGAVVREDSQTVIRR